jgi:uncharacterized GH25 family protein
MTMRKPLLLILFTLLIANGGAHEFWLEPQRFQLKPGQQVTVHFRVGEHFEGEDWTGNRQLVDQLKIYFPSLEDDMEDLVSDSTGDSLNLQFFDEGTVLMAFRSKNKFIELPADKFNAYLAEDGLDNVAAWRKEHGETDSSAREHYQRSVKTLLQVGDLKSDNYKRTTPLPLDIIPLNHPYQLRKGQELQLQVLFRKEPLAGQLVKVWHKLNGKVETTDLRTDEHGELRIPVSLAGQWMASTVRMERAEPEDTTAQWQSYWGSLTWGY